MSRGPSMSSAQLSADVLLQWGYFFFFKEVGGRICTAATEKPLIPQNILKTQRKLKTHSVGVPTVQLLFAGQPNRMIGLGQSLRGPHSLMNGGKARGKLPGSDCGSVWHSSAEVSSTKRLSPCVNLRRSLQVGPENVLSLRDYDHLVYAII